MTTIDHDELDINAEALRASEKYKKELQKKLERMNFLAYTALYENEFGKELIKEWNEKYICKLDGPGAANLEYHSGQSDFVKMILGMIETHKILIKQGDKK